MLLFRCSAALIAVLCLANCAKDSSASGGFAHELKAIVSAFASYSSTSVAQDAASCSSSFQPCIRPPALRRTFVASRPPAQQHAQRPTRSTDETRPTAAYTIIASAESWPLLSDLAYVLNGDAIRVLPVVGLSASDNLNDIQHNRVDFAIVPANALTEQAKGELRYVSRLPAETLLILARPGLTTVRQLGSRRVNIGPPGTGSEIAARALFEAEGIEPVITTDSIDVAQQRLLSGEIDASVVLTASGAFPAAGIPRGFRLLPIPTGTLAGEAYEPALIQAREYPDLITDGWAVPSIAIPSVLAAVDAPSGTERSKHLNRFLREFYRRMDLLRQPGRSAEWQDFNPAEGVAGWKRL